MTEAQKFKFYFPAWSACVRANHWRMIKGRLATDEALFSPEGNQVLAIAQQRAANAQRGPLVDDLRHACHLLALGRDKSSADLTNAELDKVVTLFQLLTDPDQLDARLAWDAYARGEDPGAVRRVEWFIVKAAPEAYVRAVSADKFGTRQWENLTVAQKKHLAMTLANRRQQRSQPLASQPSTLNPQPATDNCPF